MGAHASPAIGRRLSLALLGSGAVAILVYALTDSSAVDAALLLGSSALAPIALAAALRLHRPSFRLPWILFGAAQITWLFGWVFWERSVLAGGAPPDLDSPTHVLFVTAYPVLFAALVLLVRAREPDSASWIDAGIIAIALLMVGWAILLHRFPGDASVTSLGRGVELAYGVLDVFIFAVVLRLIVSAGNRSASLWLLLMGPAFFVVSDGIRHWSTHLDDYTPGSWTDGGWLLFPLLLGAAALHPSMHTLFHRPPPTSHTLRWDRMAVLAAAALIAPAIWFIELVQNHGSIVEQGVEAFFGGALSVLIIVRLMIVVRAEERLAIELGDRNARLLELDRSKDDFVASVSHELRTPLPSIRGYVDLLLDSEAGELRAEQRRFLEVVNRNATRLLNVVGDLLDVAQIEDGRLSLDLRDRDLAPIVADSVDAARPLADDRGIDLNLATEASARVRVDESRLAQVMDNLLSNALKFTDSGGQVDVRVAMPNGHAVVEVADSGTGIPEAALASLFQRFFRTDDAAERQIEGTGLGLWISKAIVEAHGGAITVESEPGRGTRFSVALPVSGEAE